MINNLYIEEYSKQVKDKLMERKLMKKKNKNNMMEKEDKVEEEIIKVINSLYIEEFSK